MVNKKVLSTVRLYCKNLSPSYPESLLYGYARLMWMDESSLTSVLTSQEEINDLQTARNALKEMDIDVSRICTGLMLCIPYIPANDPEINKKCEEFKQKMSDTDSLKDSGEVIKLIFKYSFLPLAFLFKNGKPLTEIFRYIDGIKNGTSETKTDEKHEAVDFLHLFYEKSDSAQSYDTVPENRFNDLAQRCYDYTVKLLDFIKGQDHAVHKFIEGYYKGEILDGTEVKKRPKATFFFFGPPGVGKTHLAECAADILGIKHKLFNMSEFTHKEANDDLIGVQDYYKSSREGILVKFVRENPNCILIFDEIEKAHQNVIRSFLQMLGSGKLYNVFKKEDTDFTKTIVIFTSNAAKKLYDDPESDFSVIPPAVLLKALMSEKDSEGNTIFPSEICSRLSTGTVVLFNHLKARTLNQMINDTFENNALLFEKEYGFHISYTADLSRLFAYGQGASLDARVATVQSGNFIKQEIFEFSKQTVLNGDDRKKINTFDLTVDLSDSDSEIKDLFISSKKSKILIFSSKEIAEMLDGIDSLSYDRTQNFDEATKLLESEYDAVFIDPFVGSEDGGKSPLSVADYSTGGVKLFHSIIESFSNLPVYILNTDNRLNDVDKITFRQEGAIQIIDLPAGAADSFRRSTEQVLEEIDMEDKKNSFSMKGWVITFRSRQSVSDDGKASIVFYDLKKRLAIDSEDSDTVLSEYGRPTETFGEVVGAEDAKKQLRFYAKYLHDPKKFLSQGHKKPKGILLYGPPGTGKTMLAKALANECDVTFIQTSGTDFIQQYIGASEEKVRSIFRTARKYAPAIVFIDEIDAIGKQRTGSEASKHTEQILNTLLTEIDGFSSNLNPKRPVFVLAATNFGIGNDANTIRSSLDDALIRRFDIQIYVDLPNKKEREQYIRIILDKKKITFVSDEIIENLAERTTGKSLAVLQNILEIPFRKAENENRSVKEEDFLQALEEYLYGEKREFSEEDYWSTAIHETGHAVVSYLSGDVPSYITIESRGEFGGYMQHGDHENILTYTKQMLIDKIRTSLAGRAAEEVFFGKDKSLNTGASSDLSHATRVALNMLCCYGMTDGNYVSISPEFILGSALAEKYLNAANAIIAEHMQKTLAIVTENKAKIEFIAKELKNRNHLTGSEFTELMKK
ncbi:MAG: AAA family ATPase [Clostridia bacterium]|nr:AAA family ATPase [Clostridia bacterium]